MTSSVIHLYVILFTAHFVNFADRRCLFTLQFIAATPINWPPCRIVRFPFSVACDISPRKYFNSWRPSIRIYLTCYSIPIHHSISTCGPPTIYPDGSLSIPMDPYLHVNLWSSSSFDPDSFVYLISLSYPNQSNPVLV